MSKGNGQAGSSCVICNTPPTCFHEYEIKTIENKKENVLFHYPVKHQHPVIIINRIHPQKSSDYTFTLKGKCVNGHEDCPKIVVGNNSGMHLNGESQDKFPLRYSDEYSFKEMALFQWLEEFFCFDIKKLTANYYPLDVSECTRRIHWAGLAIYPSHKMSIAFNYGTEASSEEIADRKRRYQYSNQELEELRNNGIGNKKWSDIGKQIGTTSTSCELVIEAEIGETKENITLKLSEKEQYSDKNPVIKISSWIKKINGSLLSGKENIGPIRDIKFISPKIEISGKKELKIEENKLYFEYSANGGFNPLFGIRMAVDLIDVVLSVIPVTGPAAELWREIRTVMENSKKKMENSNKKLAGYVIAGIDLIIYGEIGNINFKVCNDQKKDIFCEAEGGGKLDAQIKGFIEGGAKCWFVEGAIEASTQLKTSINIMAKADRDGIAYEWGHEGAKCIFMAEVSLGTSKKRDAIKYEMKPLELVLGEPYQSDPFYILNF